MISTPNGQQHKLAHVHGTLSRKSKDQINE